MKPRTKKILDFILWILSGIALLSLVLRALGVL